MHQLGKSYMDEVFSSYDQTQLHIEEDLVKKIQLKIKKHSEAAVEYLSLRGIL